MSEIDFDDEVYWDASLLIFWAEHGKNRIKCVAGRETIAELPGFTHASSKEISVRKEEIRDALRGAAIYKITGGVFSDPERKTVTIYISDVAKA